MRSGAEILEMFSGDPIVTAIPVALVYFQFSVPSTPFETAALLWQRQKMIKKSIFSTSFWQLAAKLSFLVFFAGHADGAGAARLAEFGESSMENPFDQAYWGLELASNFPAAKTSQYLSPGHAQPFITYRYCLSTGWMLGAYGGFKGLKRKDGESDLPKNLSILSLGYESLKGWRLYHPLYFFAGGKFSYLLPATAANLPLRRDDEFRAEFSGAWVAMLALKPAGKWLVTARVDRWRGLATTRLEGLETALGVLVNF